MTPERVQLRRTKGWKMPPNTVKVDRTTRWGNPFKVGTEYVRRRMTPGGGQLSNTIHSAEQAVRLFRRFTIRETIYQIEAYQALRGKNLACWCPIGEPCHADILLQMVNK